MIAVFTSVENGGIFQLANQMGLTLKAIGKEVRLYGPAGTSESCAQELKDNCLYSSELIGQKLKLLIGRYYRNGELIYGRICRHAGYEAFNVVASSGEQPRYSRYNARLVVNTGNYYVLLRCVFHIRLSFSVFIRILIFFFPLRKHLDDPLLWLEL